MLYSKRLAPIEISNFAAKKDGIKITPPVNISNFKTVKIISAPDFVATNFNEINDQIAYDNNVTNVREAYERIGFQPLNYSTSQFNFQGTQVKKPVEILIQNAMKKNRKLNIQTASSPIYKLPIRSTSPSTFFSEVMSTTTTNEAVKPRRKSLGSDPQSGSMYSPSPITEQAGEHSFELKKHNTRQQKIIDDFNKTALKKDDPTPTKSSSAKDRITKNLKKK